jgi:hypothetical protein
MSRKCPHCGGVVYRTSRRAIDRLLSLIAPVRRYHCMSLECTWVGNLPRDSAERVSSGPWERPQPYVEDV